MAEVKLQDGSSVEIRRVQRRDLTGLYQVMTRVFSEGRSMLSTEMPFTIEQLDRELGSAQETNQITYVAVKPEGVVGWLRADRRQVPFMRHIATIWLGMDSAVRGKGIGEHLILEMLGWAREQKIEKIELGVRSSNRSAIRLYERMGFIQEGKKLNAIKTESGYEDDIWMGLFIDGNPIPKAEVGSPRKAKQSAQTAASKSPRKASRKTIGKTAS